MRPELEFNDAALSEKVTGDELVYEGRLLKVHRLTVELPDGRKSTREMIRHTGASAMIALDSDGCIVLERQWRTPAGGAFWEIPAGKIDPGESPDDTARRELAEEAGLAAGRWVRLGEIRNAIGYSDERIVIYLARDLARVSQSLDDNEFLSLHRLPWRDALAMCMNGEITDVKTIIGLSWLEKYLAGVLPQARVLG